MIEPKRNNLEIMSIILRLSKHGSTKTRIVYQANLNFKMLGEYRKRLEEHGLIIFDGQRLTTTEKGLIFLQRFISLQELNGM